MIGPEHSHDLAIPVKQRLPLATAALHGEQHSPRPASSASARLSSTPKVSMRAPSSRRSATAQPSVKSILLSLISASPAAMAACVPLKGSTTCPAFQSASVSTDSFMVGLLYVCIFLGHQRSPEDAFRVWMMLWLLLRRNSTNLRLQSFSQVRFQYSYLRSANAILPTDDLRAGKVSSVVHEMAVGQDADQLQTDIRPSWDAEALA
jgi:hypothetical protein